MLSKKYYKSIAELIKVSNDLEQFERLLIPFLQTDNSRFDIDKFRQATKKGIITENNIANERENSNFKSDL